MRMEDHGNIDRTQSTSLEIGDYRLAMDQQVNVTQLRALSSSIKFKCLAVLLPV